MTRAAALLELYRLAGGLGPTLAGCDRLLERVSNHDQAEALRAALTMVGVESVLDEQGGDDAE